MALHCFLQHASPTLPLDWFIHKSSLKWASFNWLIPPLRRAFSRRSCKCLSVRKLHKQDFQSFLICCSQQRALWQPSLVCTVGEHVAFKMVISRMCMFSFSWHYTLCKSTAGLIKFRKNKQVRALNIQEAYLGLFCSFFSPFFWEVSALPSEWPVSPSLDVADTYRHAISGWVPCSTQRGFMITSDKIIITLLNLRYFKECCNIAKLIINILWL